MNKDEMIKKINKIKENAKKLLTSKINAATAAVLISASPISVASIEGRTVDKDDDKNPTTLVTNQTANDLTDNIPNPFENTSKDSIQIGTKASSGSLLTAEDIKKHLLENNTLFSKSIEEMKQNGRFFVNATNPDDVIYLTNEEVAEKNISAEADMFSVCFAREHNVLPSDSQENKDEQIMSTKGLYSLAYEYNKDNMHMLCLFSLSQANIDCQEYARRYIASAMNLSKEQTEYFVNAYKTSHEDVLSGNKTILETLQIGEGKSLLNEAKLKVVGDFINKLNNAYQKIDDGKNSVAAFNEIFCPNSRNPVLLALNIKNADDPQTIAATNALGAARVREVLNKDAGERYYIMNVNIHELRKVPMECAPAYFMAKIHRFRDDGDLGRAKNNQAMTLIDIHSQSTNPKAVKRAKDAMSAAQRHITKTIGGKKYCDLILAEQFYNTIRDIDKQEKLKKNLYELAAENIAQNPELYASITTPIRIASARTSLALRPSLDLDAKIDIPENLQISKQINQSKRTEKGKSIKTLAYRGR